MLSSLILCNNSEPFLNRIVTCNKKWILYYNHQWLAQWLDQEAASKRWNFPKPNLYQKRSQPLFGLCPSDPLQPSWNPEIPLRLRSMLDNSKWDALKTAMPATSIDQQKRPSSSPQQCLTARCTTNASKMEWIGLQSFASSAIFTDLSWQLFAGKTFPQPAECRTCFLRACQIPKHEFLCC